MPIKEFELDKWFFEEEHFRPKNDGFVFFVHTKFLLIDPLSDDPLVCSGSANFSSGSLLQNDENMLLVRGNTRIADIYMTEFDRIFRHFYFRDIANQLAAAKTSDDAKAIFLDETDEWSANYFRPRTLKNNRRLMFFEQPTSTWFANAATAGSGPGKAKKTSAKKAKKAKTPSKKKKTTKKAAKKAPARKAKKTAKTSAAKKKASKKKAAKRAVKSAKKTSSAKKSTRKTTKRAKKAKR
jgi:PLD-like domain